MKHDTEKINDLVRNNINSIETIESRRDFLRKTIDEMRLELSELSTVRQKIKKKFEFIKSQSDADKLQTLADLYPEIDSGRELQIISEMLKFKSSADIGRTCYIGEPTVKFHKTKIFRRLNVTREKGFFADYEIRKAMKDSKCQTK